MIRCPRIPRARRHSGRRSPGAVLCQGHRRAAAWPSRLRDGAPAELGGGKIERDYFAAVEIADKIQSSHGVTHCGIEIVRPAAIRRKRLIAAWACAAKAPLCD